MKKVIEFLADGFEEVEAMAPVDILRRGGVEITTVSVMDTLMVKSAHGVEMKADVMFDAADIENADLLLLPGGMPGATNLKDHSGLRKALMRHNEAGKKIGAICAAPMVLGDLGLLRGKRATCYPGFEKFLDGAEYTAELFTIDGNIITGKGPAAVFPYSYKIAEWFLGEQAVDDMKAGMIYSELVK